LLARTGSTECIESDEQVFNATNSTISLPDTNTTQFLKQQCPNVPHKREMGEDEAPLSNRKIREVLGFKEEHNWKQYTPLK
jgi:UDP-glucose 4-epimerase